MARPKDTFGTVGKTLTGPFYARYFYEGRRHTPGRTFSTEKAAWAWLRAERLLMDRGEWTPPSVRRKAEEQSSLTFGEYAETWLKTREVQGRPLRPRTVELYRSLFSGWLSPLWDKSLAALTREECTNWYLQLPKDSPTMRAHAYALTRSILKSAVDDELIPKNPLYVRGAGRSSGTKTKVELFTAAEITKLAALMPPQHKLMVLLAAWCGLRFGELAALRRADFKLARNSTGGTVTVKQAVVTVQTNKGERETSGLKHKRVVTDPKTQAGVRSIVIPPHIIPDVEHHLKKHAKPGREGLVFPPSPRSTQEFITPMQVYGHAPRKTKTGKVKPGYGYYGAREALGRPDLNFHMLRHFAGTNYAVVGATPAELLDMMGHTDIRVAQRYQHAARSRAEELASRMAAIARTQEDRPEGDSHDR